MTHKIANDLRLFLLGKRHRKSESSTDYIDRFINSLELSPTGCWNIIGYKDKNGYGKFQVRGKKYPSHRFSLMLKTDSYGLGLLACHKCNNPSCCNPKHLYWGTEKDNSRDSFISGTTQFGTKNKNCKLNNEKVIEIRSLYNKYKHNGRSGDALSKIYGVSDVMIRNIANRKSWKHI